MRARADRHLGLPNVSGSRDGRLVLHLDAICEVVDGDAADILHMVEEEFRWLVRQHGLTGPPVDMIVTGLAIPTDLRQAAEQLFASFGTMVIWSHPFSTSGYGQPTDAMPLLGPWPATIARPVPTKRPVTPRDPGSDCPF